MDTARTIDIESRVKQPDRTHKILLGLKRLVIFLSPLVLLTLTNVSSINSDQNFKTTDETVIGMLQYLPKDYHTNSDKYPLVIFLHGIIEKGVDSTDPSIIESAIHPVDNLGPPKHVKEGHQFPFILISPQLKYRHDTWPGWYSREVVNWAKKHLRIDEKRIHITGLSLGGGGVFTSIEENPGMFASAAPVCANSNIEFNPCPVADGDVAVWAFHGLHDPDIPFKVTQDKINSINECAGDREPRAKTTVYSDLKHNVWDRAYTPDHAYHRQNLYDWMMAMYNTRNGSNLLPSAFAGDDQTLDGIKSTVLNGSATDNDGKITTYSWTKLAGPTVSIADPNSMTTRISFNKNGNYIFKFSITDNGGDTDSDYVRIIVK
jgi:hypothetical protein